MSIENIRKSYQSAGEFAYDLTSEAGRGELFDWVDANRLSEDVVAAALFLSPSVGGGLWTSENREISSQQELYALIGDTRWHIQISKPDWETMVHVLAVAIDLVRLYGGDGHAVVGAAASLLSLAKAAAKVINRLNPDERTLFLIVKELSGRLTIQASLGEIVRAAQSLKLPKADGDAIGAMLNTMVREGVLAEREGIFSCN